jgi:RND superfamily putative drug exporter
MQLFGRANWWIPHWLDRRLPRFDVEPATVAEEA